MVELWREGRAVWATLLACLAVACSSAPRRPPNVLLVVVDTLRQDHLGCYGSARATSPSIDALAAGSIRFERAYSPAPWTLPAVASILSGQYPSSHGATRLTTRLRGAVDTLPEKLARAGYDTAGVVSHTVLSSRWNFHQGYRVYRQTEALGHGHVSTPGVTRQARALLEDFARGDRPFFLFVHYFDPHYDFIRHPEYGFAAPSAGRLKGDEPIAKLRGMLDELTQEEIQFIMDLYDEEIRFTDRGIGELLEALERLDLSDDTLVVLTADHGEEFLDHGWLGHTRTLYDELIRVPLIVRLPGGLTSSRIVQEPVSLVSLTPTILELAGIGGQDSGFQAESLVDKLEGGESDGDSVVFSEVDFIPLTAAYAYKTTHMKAAATRRYKLVRDEITGVERLFDLETDPHELHDISSSRAELLGRMRQMLEGQSALARGERSLPEEMELNDEQVENLRSLGYVGP